MYRVIRKQTNAQGILAQLERHLSLLLGGVAKDTPRHACIATYTDRQEILTYAQVAAMLSEIESIPLDEKSLKSNRSTTVTHLNAETVLEAQGTIYGRPPNLPFCLSFMAPPSANETRYVSTSVANEREGLLLGAVALTSRTDDYFERRGMARRPPEWEIQGSN